jgi:hypothetical protein
MVYSMNSLAENAMNTRAEAASGQLTASSSNGHTFTTTTPLLEGARYWLNQSAEPDATITTVWSSGSSHWSLRSTIGHAAKLTVVNDHFKRAKKGGVFPRP